MPDKFVSKIITPFGERLIKASALTDELNDDIKDVVYINKQAPDFKFSNISGLISLGKRVVITWSGLDGTFYYDVSVKSSSSIMFVCVKNGEYRILTLNSDDTSSAETLGISDNLAIFKAPLEGGSFSYPPISSVIGSYSEGKFVIIERVNSNSGTSSYMLLTGCNASSGKVQFNGIGIKKDLLGIIQDGVDVWQDMEMFDDNLNSYSINAVQNKTIFAAINGAKSIEYINFNTTFAEVTTILSGGKLPILVEETTPGSPNYYYLINNNAGTEYIFGNTSGTLNRTYKLSGGGWTLDASISFENSSNKVTSWSVTPSNTKYPSEKLVYDTIGDVETLLAAL